MSDSWERLGDEQAIRDVLARYWRGIDRRDPGLVLGTYHPGAFDDHGYYQGPVEGFVETLAPGVWKHFANTQHFAGNIQIDFVSADRARAESYAVAHHTRLDGNGEGGGPGAAGTAARSVASRPASRASTSGESAPTAPTAPNGQDLVWGLRYVDDFERRDGEWRIARRVCAWDWHRVDPVGGIPLPASYFRGAHSQADPVYAHPRPHGRRVEPRELVAKQACLEALFRYTRGVDRCDLALVRSAYHPDAFDDHGGYQGDVEGFLAWVRPTVMETFSCTMHKLGNVLVAVDGNQAFAETYAVAHHVAARGEGASDLVMGVRYLDRLEDRGDGWKIAHRQMSFEWERTLEIGSQREYPGFLRGQRDGSDPVVAPFGRAAGASSGVASRDAAARDAAARDGADRAPSPRGGPKQIAVPAEYAAVADRAAIHRQLVRYCRGVDRRDLELVRSTYHPDAFDDHGSYKGDVEGFLAFVRDAVHARFRTTMHKLGQSLIEIDGDVARSESYAICHHVMAEPDPAAGGASAVESGMPGGKGAAMGSEAGSTRTRDVADMVMGIRYVDRFERRGGEWRIARRELRWEWVRTDRLEALDPTWTAGRADREDAVFEGG
ncbi:MAG: nuclear transport factor 2 family protein [Myxococcota bacterium]